jgi:hypothetical protein
MALRGSRRKAAFVLFVAGFSFRSTARLLHVTTQDVIAAVRKAMRGR